MASTYLQQDTICAPATASGGALGIIRISGCCAHDAIGALCSIDISSIPANTIRHTHLIDREGNIIDEVMVSLFRAPHSYTGEDAVEISCHGSRYILSKVLELLMGQGCRMAHPGEFTLRAYLNGKMDLSQAEAVADLIASTNSATHQMALSQLRGHFSSELSQLREQLLKLTSLLELELDFSDHEELEFADRRELLNLARHIDERIMELSHSFEVGQALKEGIPVAIVGKTNVGKSTLLNQLLHDDRAIVSDIHGTTRDTVEDSITIHGISFRFIDTAGIRQTTDAIEQIGISRTYRAITKARIVLWLIDTSPTHEEYSDLLRRCEGKTLIIIQNKIDKDATDMFAYLSPTLPYQFKISAKQGQGIDALEQALVEASCIPVITENDIIVTNARHYDALQRSHTSLSRVIEGLEMSLSSDLLAEDLRLTIDYLADITGGQITPQETLNNIFSHFCVGK